MLQELQKSTFGQLHRAVKLHVAILVQGAEPAVWRLGQVVADVEELACSQWPGFSVKLVTLAAVCLLAETVQPLAAEQHMLGQSRARLAMIAAQACPIEALPDLSDRRGQGSWAAGAPVAGSGLGWAVNAWWSI